MFVNDGGFIGVFILESGIGKEIRLIITCDGNGKITDKDPVDTSLG